MGGHLGACRLQDSPLALKGLLGLSMLPRDFALRTIWLVLPDSLPPTPPPPWPPLTLPWWGRGCEGSTSTSRSSGYKNCPLIFPGTSTTSGQVGGQRKKKQKKIFYKHSNTCTLKSKLNSKYYSTCLVVGLGVGQGEARLLG